VWYPANSIVNPIFGKFFAVMLLGCAAMAGHAVEPTAPVRLTGAFQAVSDDVARAAGSIPGRIWNSDRSDQGGMGALRLAFPVAPDTLELNISGYHLHESTVRLSLLSPDLQRELKLGVRSSPNGNWCLQRWKLPDDWRGKPVVFLAEDNSPDSWLGVGLPESRRRARAADWVLAGSSLSAVLLTILPFFTALVLLQRRFAGDPVLHVTLALVASGIFALAVFFGFYFSHTLGLALVVAGLGAALYAGRQFWRHAPLRMERFTPLLAVLALATLVVATLFLYGGTESPDEVAGNRHDMHLPADNQIPEMFVERIFRREPLRPFAADWLTSDRPPLQTGYLLVSRAWVTQPGGRIAAAITCQFAVYAGLWALLAALGVPRQPARLCLLACVTSGFFLLNTLYTWPKLLPAGFLLGAAALLFRIGRENRRATGVEIFALGGCAALAMLGHGGSIFGLLALGGVHALRGGWRDYPLIAGSATLALLLFAPWLAYQHWADPPGDRLLKFHLAGRIPVDPRGALTVIAEAYRQTPGLEIARNKWSNVRVLAGDCTYIFPSLGRTVMEIFTGDVRGAWWRFSNAMQNGEFFHLVQSLGFLLTGLPFLWVARRQPLAAAGGWCATVALVSIGVWCALMFGPESTVVHQGTYLTGALLHVAAVLGLLASGRPRLILAVFVLHLSLWLCIWIFSPSWDMLHRQLRPAWSPFWLVTWFTAAAALVWSGGRLAVATEDESNTKPEY